MAACQEKTMRIVASGSILGGYCYDFFDCPEIRLPATQTSPSRVSAINDLRNAGGCRNNRSSGLSKLRECAARQKGYSGRLDRARNRLAIEQPAEVEID
jgi:hypothetical protein